MEREQIIRMANESNLLGIYADEAIDSVIRFADLVASAERERIKQANAPEIERINAHIKELEDAVKAEREACAKVCEQQLSTHGWAQACIAASAIRARGGHD